MSLVGWLMPGLLCLLLRCALGLAVALVTAVVPGALASRAQTVGAASATPMVFARTIRNGLGVSGRPGLDADVAMYAAMLDQIHVRDIRSPIVSGGISQARHWEELQRVMQRAGVADPHPRFTALVGAYLNDPATTWAIQQTALLDVAGTGLLFAIEGPNEVNNPLVGGGAHPPGELRDDTHAADFPQNYVAWARAIHDFKQAHPAPLGGVILVAPSIASGLRADYARLPDVSGAVDVGNIHFYAGGGRQPDFSTPVSADVGSFDSIYDWAHRAEIPNGRVWLTESGASTSGNYATDGLSQAKYLANQIMEYFAAGGPHMFVYNLIDPKERAGTVEDHFGMFHADGSPKPAALMLGALQDLLSLGSYSDARNTKDVSSFKPGYDAGALTLHSAPGLGGTSARALVIAKSDRSTIVAVWNEASVDDGHGHDLAPAAQLVTLDFGGGVRFRVHDLFEYLHPGANVSGGAFVSGTSLDLELRGYPLLVELSPHG